MKRFGDISVVGKLVMARNVNSKSSSESCTKGDVVSCSVHGLMFLFVVILNAACCDLHY